MRPTSMASDVAEFLDEVCKRLIVEGKSSRDLVALEFDPEIEHLNVLIRKEPHVGGYPDLASILGELGRTCSEHGVELRQLRRITFFEEEIGLELADVEGKPEVRIVYPIPKRDLET